jgi:hypothetical protein
MDVWERSERRAKRFRLYVIILASIWCGTIIGLALPAESKCRYPCKSDITNKHRQKVGDIYKPAPGRRTQIRDRHRRIIGYIEADGTLTNKRRQKILEIKP